MFLLSKNSIYSMTNKNSEMHKHLALLTIVIITFIIEAENDFPA